eukprot:10296235-Alexandrium_andersonii.AAC.1
MEGAVERHLQGDRSSKKRPRAQCLGGLVAAWCTPAIAETCARGRWRNHLTNALEGSEDSLGR